MGPRIVAGFRPQDGSRGRRETGVGHGRPGRRSSPSLLGLSVVGAAPASPGGNHFNHSGSGARGVATKQT